MYVSASRAHDQLALFTDDREAVKRAIQRSSQKVAALDLKPEREAAAKHRGCCATIWSGSGGWLA